MFWDGERWLPEDGRTHANLQPRAHRRRIRDWLSTGVMVLALAALVVPFAGAAAARPSARAQIANWSATSEVAIYQEGNRQINYQGGWVTAYYSDYLGGKARATDAAGAKASLKFRGAAVSWVGPIGPTRGKARVYIDGRQVATVGTWNESFRPTRVLFRKSWDTVGTHRIAIVAVGTEGHPTVALDAFVVRLDTGTADTPVDDAGAPIGTAPPEEPAPPAPPSPTAEPTVAPTDAPVPTTPQPTTAPTLAPTPSPTPVAPAPTATPRPTVTPAPTATPAPAPTATPAPAPTASTSVRVASIPALLTALDDNSVTDIVVANGTYRVSPAAAKASNSLWIGSRFADRTRPVTVRAETAGGVTFDGGGTSYFGCLSFQEGAHDQVWDGFRCAGGQATSTGVIMFGGYAGAAAPHHITLRRILVDSTCTGRATSASSSAIDHAVYVSKAVGGPHDLVFDNLVVDGRGGLASAFHFYHSDSTNQNAWNVTIRGLTVTGTVEAIMLWDSTLHDITIDGASITNALNFAVRYEAPGGSRVTLAHITSTGSGSGRGFYSSLGSAPAGVTFIDNSFR